MHGRQEVGHIDLLARISYIEVPEQDADKVMRALNGATYRNRTVRCNDADDTAAASSSEGKRGKRDGGSRSTRRKDNKDDFSRYEKRSKRRNEDEGRIADNAVSVVSRAMRVDARTTGDSLSTIPT